MKIISIIRNPQNVPANVPCEFHVGRPIIEGGHTVKEILFCRDGYTNGPGKDPVYIIKYEGIPEVNQIPAIEVVDTGVDPEVKTKTKTSKVEETAEAGIALPEA